MCLYNVQVLLWLFYDLFYTLSDTLLDKGIEIFECNVDFYF